ncbi:MAG: rhodanese-like domain-containing protein [Treponema sp.]|nr:rhodanese-like domain-containing protein [Treponema sp.]
MKLIGCILLAAASFSMGCTHAKAQQAQYRKISAAEAHKMMLELKDLVVLDVRTPEEFREKHINGAILIPDFELKDRAEKELPVKDKVILVYCRSGRRSANAAGVLAGLGYVNVYDFGGIMNWPYETTGN